MVNSKWDVNDLQYGHQYDPDYICEVKDCYYCREKQRWKNRFTEKTVGNNSCQYGCRMMFEGKVYDLANGDLLHSSVYEFWEPEAEDSSAVVHWTCLSCKESSWLQFFWKWPPKPAN